MRVIAINTFNIGSTGNIMLQIAEEARKKDFSVITCCPKSRDNLKKTVDHQILIGNRYLRNIHIILSKLTGYNGCFSVISTIRFLRRIDQLNPQLLHFHNLHGWYINLPILFHYVKRKEIPVIWTLHDCWAFTGQCPHFTMVKCDKWKTGCHHCPSYREYPAAMVDRTKIMWKLKKEWFTDVKDLTIITPSQWLADLVKESYLKDYPVKVINNGIDLSVFKPTESDFREKHGIPAEKKIVLGVAFGWGKRKGLDVFIELANRLDEREYQIVLVGTDDTVDMQLPKNIISIHRTHNQQELAEIYTAADVFANPTREEVLGLVNIEALACGTPVVTFDSGGSPETIDKTCGIVIPYDDVDSMEREIKRICEKKLFSQKECILRAEQFEKKICFDQYVAMYTGVLECKEE